MKKITLLLIALIATLQTQATHIIGGQITSRCLGGLTQEITTTLYVDNQGIPMGNSITVNYSSNNFTWTVFRTIQYSNQYSINPTTNAFEFIDTITVPYLYYYTFSYETCCRSASVTNISSASTPLHIETVAFIDTTCNSTPIIPVNPIPYAVFGTQATYPLNAYDLDGDSLGYQLITPLQGANMQIGGYTFLPINMSTTGVMNMFTSFMGIYDVCVKVIEYRNGSEIGYVLREMQIVVNTSTGIDEIKNIREYEFQNSYDIIGRKIK